MNFLFFDRNDELQFIRDDASDAIFTHGTLNLAAAFPINKDKLIEDGMRIGFLDRDSNFQLFEIRVLINDVPGNMQTIESAEHVAIAELTDEIVEDEAPASETAKEAATIALTGSAWAVGTYVSSDDNSTEWSYMTRWACLCDIRDTWGVRIVPRLTISGTAITGRYIDIVSATPVNRGVRLEVNKNLEQAGVTYDDHAQYTALYGFGKEIQSDSGSEKLKFSGVEWATPTNPANKPIGQEWVEDTAATALYGRNGRKRVGIVEFPDIEDSYDLLDATWTYLQASLAPSVTIDCTILDLYKIGYAGEYITDNDTVTCIIDPLNVAVQLCVVDIDEDLLRPENTKPTIGVYRPDIVGMINDNIADTRSQGRLIGQPATGLYTSYIAIYDSIIKTLAASILHQTDNFQVMNLAGNNMLQITAEDEETGEPGARLKLGESGYPPLFEDDFVLPLKNGGFGDTFHRLHWVTSVPSNDLGIDGDTAIRYAGSGSSFSDIAPSIGSYETTTRFGLTRVWNRSNGSPYVDIGNSSAARRGCYWSFTTPAAGFSSMGLKFTVGKIIDGVWYGWNLDLPITVAVYANTGSSTPLGSATFIPDNYMKEVNIPLTFDTPLAGETTYYIAIYDPSSAYNKSSALIQTATVMIPGESSADSEVGVYVKVGGHYTDVTAAVVAALSSHVLDKENPHEVTAAQAGAVPTGRKVNRKALSTDITLSASDVRAAAANHAHGHLLNDGQMEGITDEGQFVITGTGGKVTTATGAAARTYAGAAAADHAHGNINNDGTLGTSDYHFVITGEAGYMTDLSPASALTLLGGSAAAHTHGNISNDGKIGSTANLPVFTGASGLLGAISAGTARTNLGLGAAAVLATGTTNGTIPLIGAGDKLATSVIPAISDLGAVPTSRTVNGHALTGDVSVTLGDVGGAAASHAHGNLLNDGTFAAGADKAVITGVGGGITTATFAALKSLLAIIAGDIPISDAGEYYSGATVEAALQELGGAVGGTPSASNVTISDSGDYYTAENIEAALQEIGASLALKSSSDHVHGNISNDGKIGSTANLPVFTGASGLLGAISAGTARTNLGLGAAAVLATGTTNGTIPLIGAGDKLATSVIPAISDLGAVPTSRTVNGHALTGDVSVTLGDVGGAAASHAHGNLLNDGTFAAGADKAVITGVGGGITTATFAALKSLLAIIAGDIPISDAGEYYSGATVEAALQELGGAVGGTPSASNVTISDSGEHYTSENVEGALQEIGVHEHGYITNSGKIGSISDLFCVTGTAGVLNVISVAAAKTLLAIIGTDVSISDSGDYYTAENIEAALQEIGASLALKSSSDHVHGNITNDGKIGSTANLFVVTGASGGITVASGLAARGTMRIFYDDTEPASPANGDLWFPAAT